MEPVWPKRIVLKIGSAVIAPNGVVDEQRIAAIAAQCALVQSSDRQLVIVSSGAVAAGRGSLCMTTSARSILQKQAAAAVGQPLLMSLWRSAFETHSVTTAQALLTSDDLENRTRAVNARHTLAELIRRDVVPIVNENDAVSFDEIRVGDNDHLGALVAALLDADMLIMLSSADGLRRTGGTGDIIRIVNDYDEAQTHVAPMRSADGTGGMSTKLDAMRIATACGIEGVLIGGEKPDRIMRALAGEQTGTRFPAVARRNARRGWIGHGARVEGSVAIDDGARTALLENGASLLPPGILSVEGQFDCAAVIEVRSREGEPIGRGIAAYSSDEIRRIAGHSTDKIESILGYDYSDEIIHRDDLSIDPRLSIKSQSND
jgi:glutamate 5-kinase